jgi:hypothetical protein
VIGYAEQEVPASAYSSLLADGKAYQLYQQFGFVLTALVSVGMGLQKERSSGSGT